jgi:hypothetical protein
MLERPHSNHWTPHLRAGADAALGNVTFWFRISGDELSPENIIRMIKSRRMRWHCSTNGGDEECI